MQPSLGTRNRRRVCPQELPPKGGAGRRLGQSPRLAEVQLGNRSCGDGSFESGGRPDLHKSHRKD